MILKRKIKNKDPTLVYNHCSQNKNKNFGKKKNIFPIFIFKTNLQTNKNLPKEIKGSKLIIVTKIMH